MAQGKRLSRAKVKKAIKDSGGVIAAIARKVGASWLAVRDFIRNDEELSTLLRDEEETIDDIAEAAVITEIRKGDTHSAKWWLARRRRNKYGDNVQVENIGGVTVRIVDETEDDQASG